MAITDPTDISDLYVWLDGSDATTLYTDYQKTTLVSADGQEVQRWADKSGNGYDVIQSTAGKYPLYKTGVKKGQSALQWVEGDESFAHSTYVSVKPSWGTDRTAIAVAIKSSASGTAGTLVGLDYNTTPRLGSLACDTGGNLNFHSVDGSNLTTDAITYTVDQWGVFAGRSAGTSVEVFLDNVSGGATACSVTPNSGSKSHYIGSGDYGSTKWQGYIAEVLIYNKRLSDAEMDDVYTYLYDKWMQPNAVAVDIPLLEVAITTMPGIAIGLPLLEASMTATVPQVSFSMGLPLLQVESTTGENANVACSLPLLSQALYTGAKAAMALPLLGTSATAEVGTKADAAWSLPLLSVAAKVGAKASCTLPLLSVASTADAEILARASAVLPLLKPELAATSERLAQVSCQLPLLKCSLSSTGGSKANVACSLPLLQAMLGGEAGEMADMACSLPLFSLAAGMSFDPSADVSCELPMLTLASTGTQVGRFDNFILRYTPPA